MFDASQRLSVSRTQTSEQNSADMQRKHVNINDGGHTVLTEWQTSCRTLNITTKRNSIVYVSVVIKIISFMSSYLFYLFVFQALEFTFRSTNAP